MELTRRFTAEQFESGLGSWEWLGLDGRTPVFASPFGDVFFESGDGIWLLDTIEGSLSCRWPDPAALEADLRTDDGQDQFLLAGLALAAEKRGLVPAETQVYGFTSPPVLGGALDVDNVEVIDFVVSLNTAGQIHEQVRDLPPGTPIRIS
ncbi:T6SS immunity protein Tdi1 domain-containing protein [Actinophytocola algeriensis]|uniref:T6SS immunity protein Tdi1 C-terminal domain-containing protein n=1 Tax=Actinophytocola algeriensis TaxID=1768010 RepID=A0A7W7Q059_9PSEU|nr:T6SS immunity protein Tdi1 domain-containing protein [Actinophytocola algeriensis]MBB4904444.1 hypothetical protein [Actinophytocola algeriensis]MBE1476697.1 hypothetical protein [Actinophytocola algeriensis]